MIAQTITQFAFTNMCPAKRTTTCARCGKQLTDPRSVDAGMGAICRGHANQGASMNDDTAKRTQFTDQFNGEIPFVESFIMARAGNHGDADNDRSIVVTNVPHLVVHHSPDGYEFGYGGSGAADLALNACQLYLNVVNYSGAKTKCWDGYCWKLAWFLHQDFKREFIQGVNWRKGAAIPFEKLDRWFKSNMTSDLLRECRVEVLESAE